MSALQRHWDGRAAANFMLGGAGAGLVACAPLTGHSYLVFAGLAMIAAGLGAVWLEIGRKLRAAHVLFNPFTSWMTREAFAALLLFPLAMLYPLLAAPLALAFLYCQARILRASKGIPAWRAREVVALVVSTGLAEGAGLALVFSAERWLLGAFAAAVAVRYFAWRQYRAAVPSEALEPAGRALGWVGTGAALVLLPIAPPVAGLAAAACGAWLKLALVTRASFKQGFSLPHLPVRGAR